MESYKRKLYAQAVPTASEDRATYLLKLGYYLHWQLALPHVSQFFLA